MLSHSEDFPTDKVWVKRDERQRKKVEIDDLIPSIRERGILQPILIKRDGELVFGERRWTTATFLKHKTVPVRFVENLSVEELQVIELEENIKRKSLTWQEECAATLRIHRLYCGQNPEWDEAQSGVLLGFTERWVRYLIRIAEAIEDGDTAVAAADTIRAADTILTRRRQRQQDSVLNAITSGEFDVDEADEEEPELPFEHGIQMAVEDKAVADVIGLRTVPKAVAKIMAAPVAPYRIEHADMTEKLAGGYEGNKFNFLHLDLPYGVALNGQANQDSFEGGGYESSPDIYWNLLDTLIGQWDSFMFESSHFMCWISMEFYEATIARFESGLAGQGVWVCKTPLIWHKTDNKGIISDAKRRSRNIYEACLYGSTGDRFIVKPGSNVYGAPTAKAQAIHTNEKPIPMLEAFMGQFVDETSRVLDPTAGSGSAIRAAEKLKAELAVGWEFNEDFAKRAEDRLVRDRQMAALSEKISA